MNPQSSLTMAENKETREPYKKSGAISLLLTVLTIWLMRHFYVGFQAADDMSYTTGSLGWITSFPYVGTTHWALRHTITIPAAISIRAFGFHEYSVSLTNSIYFIPCFKRPVYCAPPGNSLCRH
jgi:hypothetical protein